MGAESTVNFSGKKSRFSQIAWKRCLPLKRLSKNDKLMDSYNLHVHLIISQEKDAD